MMQKIISVIAIIVTLVLLSNVFSCNLIDPLVFKSIRFPIVFLFVILLLFKRNELGKRKMVFSRDIKWLMCIPCFSWISAMLAWGQSPIGSMVTCFKFYILLLFFVCFAYKVSSKTIICIFSMLTIIVFVIQMFDQFISSPPFLFGGRETDDGLGYVKRGLVYRISILINVSTIVLFYYWDKLIKGNNKKISILFIVMCLMLTYFTCTRQIIIATLLSLVYISVVTAKKHRLSILVLGIGVLLLLEYGSIIFESLINLTENQTSEGSLGERNNSYAFYWNKIITNPLIFLIGSGNAYGGFYEKTMFYWTNFKQYIIVDIGHVGQFFLYGIGYIIVFFLLQYRLLIKYKRYLPNYLFCYFLYINIIGFMIAPLERMDAIATFALAVYLADIEIQNKRKLVNNENK